MMRAYKAYVPDELWKKLGTEVSHFRYHDPTPDQSTAVYVDGHEEVFDSAVTPEREAESRYAWLRELQAKPGVILYSGELTVQNPKFQGQLKKIT